MSDLFEALFDAISYHCACNPTPADCRCHDQTGRAVETVEDELATLESALHQAAILINTQTDRAELAEAELADQRECNDKLYVQLAGAKARADRAEHGLDLLRDLLKAADLGAFWPQVMGESS